MRLKLLLAYDGTAYSGWQIQEKSNPPPTIQGAVETALFSICGEKIRVYGSGRTDAGVHAWGQVAHLDINSDARNLHRDWRGALNAILPADIRVMDVAVVPDSFHARKDATSKTYIYDFWRDKRYVDPRAQKYVWQCGDLDLQSMWDSLSILRGWHDFASFQNAGTTVSNTRRAIFSIDIEEMAQNPWLPRHLPILRLKITANGFLKQMARNIAGFLAYAGKGKLRASDLHAIFQAGDRRALQAPTAPARGLTLAHVSYEGVAVAGVAIEEGG